MVRRNDAANRMEGPQCQNLNWGAHPSAKARKVQVIVVYKVDRLTRSLADFAKLVELFDAHGVSFVSVTQQFNTTTSMGRLASRPSRKSPPARNAAPVTSICRYRWHSSRRVWSKPPSRVPSSRDRRCKFT